MAQIFHPITNAISRFSLMMLLLGLAGTVVGFDVMHRTPYATEVDVPREQLVPFSHKHHANMGIDCRYCHTSVEDSNFAGIPPTKTCINCHSMVWNEAPVLEPVRQSWKTGQSLEWIRVHDLPQFVYFNHSIHIKKGIGCSTCHGRVDQMPLVRKQNTLYMKWCLDCHREPEKFIRPKDAVYAMDYQPPANQLELGRKLVEEYKIDSAHQHLANCYLCHR